MPAQTIRNKRRPSRLVLGSKTPPVVSVEILVEENVVSPERIVGVAAQ